MTRAERITKCAKYLRLRIPEPAPPKRKAQKSYAQLKAGDHLELQQPMQVGGEKLPTGVRFEVEDPSNLGIRLRKLANEPNTLVLNLNDREWKTSGLWKKVRRPTKKKLAQ